MRISIIAGARPNFMKIAPIIRAIEAEQAKGRTISYRLIHTGQHYDKNLSDTFFTELGIPKPDVNLEAGSGSQAEQTASVMMRFEEDLKSNPADLVLVVGDVNSTMACSIVAKKERVLLAHVEAGIRSGDLGMPEEINRIVTDSLSDYLFTTSETAGEELLRTGKSPNQIFFTGNVMIDTLMHNLDNLRQPEFWDALGLREKGYYVVTLHRPSNVDEENSFRNLLSSISENAGDVPIIFPVHPRTMKIIEQQGIDFPNLHFVEPQGYLSFIYLIKYSAAVLTDSGGITEEASIMNIPCLTFRSNTERPETITLGTNELVGNDPDKIGDAFARLKSGQWKESQAIPKWDGKAAERIVEQLIAISGE